MDHLTVDEIINFVSFDNPDAGAVANAVRVNTHIRSCAECMRKVRAYQAVYDEFLRICNKTCAAESRVNSNSSPARTAKKVYSLRLTENHGR